MHALTARHQARKPPADGALGPSDAVAPAAALADPAALDHRAASGHAEAGVNCAACHAPAPGEDAPRTEIEAQWMDSPPMAVCEDCHKAQAKTFVKGRHGMRRHPRIARPREPGRWLKKVGLGGVAPEAISAWLADPAPPARMTVAEARLPMRSDAAGRAFDCGTCHRPHPVDTARAATEACASCHDDRHTRAYFDSPHDALRQAELAGRTPPGTGVTCATCHMPRTERRGKITTNHNQNASLRPNEKMEGLEYVVDNPGENFYGEEELGGERYFAAVYADYAVVEACVDCHNNHKDSPRTDLEVGDVMGGVVIRIPME